MTELSVTPACQEDAIEVSSTGTLGSSYRSEERYYTNNPYAVHTDTIDRFVNDCTHHLAVPEQNPGPEATRAVVRTIMSRTALAAIVNECAPLAAHIEAAAPVPQTDDLLVYFARNYGDRNASEEVKREMTQRVSEARRHTMPSGNIILPPGFETVQHWDNPEELARLWGETFGWTAAGCEAFLHTVAEQTNHGPHERTTWFEGIRHGNRLVAATMAERLSVPGNDGPIELVELTEWAVDADYRGHNIGRFAVRHSAEAVEDDLADTTHLAFAETNILSGAHHVARRAGLEIPYVELPNGRIVNQVVFSNVRVGDGLEPKGEYRHFALATAK